MNRKTWAMLAVGALAIVGCENKSPPGGPGTPRSDGRPPALRKTHFESACRA